MGYKAENIKQWNTRAPAQSAPKPVADAWRAVWVSLNTTRTALFEDEKAAYQKAYETGGCVFPLYRSALRAPEAADAGAVATKLKQLADGAYTQYISDMRKVDCLGWEEKVRAGKFGAPQLNALIEAGRKLGEHQGLSKAVAALRASPSDAGMRERAALGFCKWLTGFLNVDDELTSFDAETIRAELRALSIPSTKRNTTTSAAPISSRAQGCGHRHCEFPSCDCDPDPAKAEIVA
jgi:hypothetical protein